MNSMKYVKNEEERLQKVHKFTFINFPYLAKYKLLMIQRLNP